MIRTVTGIVDKKGFKKACIHEHVCIVSNDMLNTFGKPGWLGNEHDADYHVYKLNYQEKIIKPKFTGNLEDFDKMMCENILNVLDV